MIVSDSKVNLRSTNEKRKHLRIKKTVLTKAKGLASLDGSE